MASKKDGERCSSQAADETEMMVSLEIPALEKLYNAVHRSDDHDHPITPRIFTAILQENNSITEEAAERLFAKIDWSSLQVVSWSEFCTFLHMKFKIKELEEAFRKEMDFCTPVPIAALPHRDRGVAVMGTADGLWISVSSGATIALWNSQAGLKRYSLCTSKERTKKTLQQWVTGCSLMSDFSKVMLTTGDREIRFYDMASFSPICQINGLESIPIAVDYRALNRERCLITYGDQMGCVSILIFLCVWKSFRVWKKLPKHEDFIPTIPIDLAVSNGDIQFARWHVHKDWVLMIRYSLETDQIISCSKDPHASLVIGNRRGSTNVARMRREGDPKNKKTATNLYSCCRTRFACDQVVYSLSRGINVFDYSNSLKMVATGGTDHMIRLWNCFLNKEPIAKLWGHYHVIKYLHLCHRSSRLYSVSADLWVKVWDVLDYTCLLTVPRHMHHVTGMLRSVGFCSETDTLALLGDNIGILKIKSDEGAFIIHSHDFPVNCILYNPLFNQIISACEESTVKTWDVDTGRREGLFVKAHDSSGVAAMTLDTTNKRLITVARDGTGRMWNYNTGVCMRTFQPVGKDVPISTVTYMDMRNVKYVLTGGWNHRLNLYIDDTPETIPFEVPLLAHWRDDRMRGHKSDILCSDYSLRAKAATGSFEGNVMVWNIEASCRAQLLVPPPPKGWSQEKLEADRGVSCLHFLKKRSKARQGGNLVVGGPYGHLSIWSTHFASKQASIAMAYFPVSDDTMPDDVVSVSAIISDEDDVVLVTGDSSGRVTVWDISTYALTQREESPPKRLWSWEAHLKRVTGVQVMKGFELVASSSMDTTVRLWTKSGHYIGTFGQSKAWEVGDESTYQHPNVPRDISHFHYNPEDDLENDTDVVDEESEMELTTRQVEHYEIGLRYFALKKATLSKRGRHLNDEVCNPFACIGNVTPYHSIRHHSLQSPPELPDMHTIEQHIRTSGNMDIMGGWTAKPIHGKGRGPKAK